MISNLIRHWITTWHWADKQWWWQEAVGIIILRTSFNHYMTLSQSQAIAMTRSSQDHPARHSITTWHRSFGKQWRWWEVIRIILLVTQSLHDIEPMEVRWLNNSRQYRMTLTYLQIDQWSNIFAECQHNFTMIRQLLELLLATTLDADVPTGLQPPHTHTRACMHACIHSDTGTYKHNYTSIDHCRRQNGQHRNWHRIEPAP